MAAYRYHKIEAVSPSWHSLDPYHYFCVFYYVKFYTGTGQTGTEFAVLGTAFATDNDGTNTANKANDGNDATYWASGTSNVLRHWGVDNGSGNSYEIKSLSLKISANVYGASMPSGFLIKGSNDNSTWFDLLPTKAALYTTNTTTDGTVYNFDIPVSASDGGFPLINGGMIR